MLHFCLQSYLIFIIAIFPPRCLLQGFFQSHRRIGAPSQQSLQEPLNNEQLEHSNVLMRLPCWKDIRKSALVLLTSTITLSQPFVAPSISMADDWNDKKRLIAETWRTVDDLYYDRTFNGVDWFKVRQDTMKGSYKTDEELYQGLKGMLSKLGDKYTRYLSPAQYSALMNSAIGELTGVGVELLGQDDGSILISNVEDDSPALDAGILRGDLIINIDGTDTRGLSPEEVAVVIRGKKDTKASLRLSRQGKILDIVCVRRPFKLQGVTWKREKSVDGKEEILVIKMRSFSSNTRDGVLKALEELYSSSSSSSSNTAKPVAAIALDLRGNGGGLLQAAVETANLFLPPGKIVTFEVNKEGKTQAFQTLPGGIPSSNPNLPDLNTPLYILVNKETASAAEVLSAALKENGRAKLVGEKTFGKGVIQTLSELQQGGVAVTIAKYETPNHNNINKIGIPADIPTACDDANYDLCIQKLF